MSRPGWPEYQRISSPAGEIPAIWRSSAPDAPARPFAVLFVPPFAEEMNRTRRLMALAGQQLASRGIPSLLPDLPGTGDSPMPFRDATWEGWLEALRASAAHLKEQGYATRIVGIRLGGLLAADALAQGLAAEALYLLDPIEDGRLHMRHWLRTRSAASLEIGPRITLTYLQTQLDSGNTVEVAGYEMGPQLTSHISTLKLPTLLDAVPGIPVHRLNLLAPGAEARPSGNGPAGNATPRTLAVEAPWNSYEPSEPVELAAALVEMVENFPVETRP